LEAVLWLISCGGGVHLNEGLGLKTIDCDLTGSDKKLIVQRQPDDRDDPRLKPALTKTLPHPVPIDDHLAHVLHGFIVNHPEGDLDLPSSADRRHGAMEEPGSKHSISENTTDPASLLAVFVADHDAKLTAFDK
jgi:hypothetical protein